MVKLVRVFTPEEPLWGLSDLARQLGWDKATTYRFATELVDLDILERTDDRYGLGTLPVKLSAVYMSVNSQRQEVMRKVDDIAVQTGFTTQLSVLDGDRIAIIASAEGTRPLKAAAVPGQRLPLHATAMGKAMLSELTDEQIRALLTEPLAAYTERTITSVAKLLEEVWDVRTQGLAKADSELNPGLYVIASPIPAGVVSRSPCAMACAGPPPMLAPDGWELAEGLLRDLGRQVRQATSAVDPAL